ncbi:hypothetical protein L3Y34_001148 [Caenorhabditis briggsae]|uniref:Uncharacterized protein n=1 Tax=Caenorhabditis briggsae TaxID=6238 RepID=A0AAE9IQ40_CAEBR|nr:hypothetical protein L3Y34_001148 [Caenorhabditis briggsae]
MTTPTQDENQASNNQESSEEEDTTFVGKILGRDQYKINDDFRLKIDSMVKYLSAMRGVTDGIQSMCLSGKSWHFDVKSEVPNSGWRYMPNYLKKVEYTKKNAAEADGLRRLLDNLGRQEEERYYNFYQVEHDSNVVITSHQRRDEVEKTYRAVEVLVQTCNRRRKKVEKALIVKDLREQCTKYHKSVNQLDVQLLRLSNLFGFVKASLLFHFGHFQQGMVVLHQEAVARSDAVKEYTKKRQQEKAAREKSSKNKSAQRNRTLKK